MPWIIAGPLYPYRGGIAHFTTALSRTANASYDVKVVSFSRLYPGLLFPGNSTLDPSSEPQIVSPWALIDSLSPISWWRIAKQIRVQNPELVVFQWWTTFLAPCYGMMAFWLKKWRIPVHFLIHNVLPHEPRWFDRWLTRAVLSQASGYIVLAQQEQRRLSEILPEAAKRTVVHQHPVYVHIPRASISKQTARNQLAIPPIGEVLLFFGFVRPYKGLLSLLQAVAKLKEDGKMIFLLVAGEIWLDKVRLSAEVDRLRIRDCVRFDDRYIPDEEVPVYFAAADLFVAPYVKGTQSGSMRLALSQGIPMVVSSHLASGIASLTSGQVRTFPAGDVEELSKAISAQLDALGTPELVSRGLLPGERWEDLVESLATLAKSRPGQR